MNMITAFSIILQLHWILLILVLPILDFTYLVALVVAIFEIEFGKNSKILLRFKEKSIPLCRAGPPAHIQMTNFHLTWLGSRQNQVRSHLGGLAHFSYEHAKFFKGVS